MTRQERAEGARLEQGIARTLTASGSAPVALPRPRAIYRVVRADAGFAFTRTVSGANGAAGVSGVERFGPYATQRAAHELAQRAAARFLAEHPGAVVGVVDIEPEAVPAPELAACSSVWTERLAARKARVRAKQRAKYARRVATPEGREQMRERHRERYLKRIATPEDRERERQRWRKKRQPAKQTIVCETERDGIVPTCADCGKPTGFYHGRPLRFCPRPVGEERSPCQIRYSNRLRADLIRNSPEFRLEHARRQREWNAANPEKRREKQIKDRSTLRNNPRRYAAKLAAERKRKARRRAEDRVLKDWDEPTGSVLLTASPRALGRELLASVYAAVPSRLPPALRMEIISETAALVLEGIDLSAAVTRASKSVRKNASLLRYTKPIDDCFWLADDSFAAMEADQ